MSVEGLEEVVGRLELAFKDIAGERTENAVTEMLISAAAHSAALTPVATGNLLNSQGRKVVATQGRVDGSLHYGAKYAPYVHRAPGKLKGLGVYRSPKRYGFVWDPNAEPQFLLKGVNEMIANDKDEIIKRNYEL